MKCDDVLARLAPLYQDLKSRYGVSSLFLFGSVARNEATPQSDVDLLVEFEKPIGLFDFIGLQQNLESVLGCKVDLGTKRSLKIRVMENVLKEAIRVA
ncbi:MAG: nucleotidyltransferase [Anaerolinea sp.]|nr:nucleotidyltransferase [Anaerolinea sp.]